MCQVLPEVLSASIFTVSTTDYVAICWASVFKNVFILRELVTTQSHNSSSNTLFLWWLHLFYLIYSYPLCNSPGNQKWTGFSHLTSWENGVYESEWTLTLCELEITQVIQICLSESAWLSSSFTSNPFPALLHTFREHLLGFLICWEIPHFNTQMCGFASFVLAKSWDITDKLLPILVFYWKSSAEQQYKHNFPSGKKDKVAGKVAWWMVHHWMVEWALGRGIIATPA